MKITANLESLLAAARATAQVVTVSTKPIFECVRIEADKGGCLLEATDLETRLTHEFAANVASPGVAAVRATLFFDALRSLKGDEVVIERKKSRLEASCGGALLRFECEPEDQYPAAGDMQAPAMTMPAELLLDMLERTEHAIGTEAAKYVLNGLLVDFQDTTARVVACDGRRLAMMTGGLQEKVNEPVDGIVGAKPVRLLQRLLAGCEGDVDIRMDQRALEVSTTGWSMQSRLLDGSFPEWRDIVPEEFGSAVELDAEALRDALKQVRPFTSIDSKACKLSFDKGGLAIDSASALGSACATVDAAYDGDKVVIGLDPSFVLDALGALGDRCEFRFSNARSAVAFVDPSIPTLVCIIMPLIV